MRFAERRLGWAIDDADGRLMPARFFYGDGRTPDHLHGITTAVFSTRMCARVALKKVRKILPDACLVRVKIAYETQP